VLSSRVGFCPYLVSIRIGWKLLPGTKTALFGPCGLYYKPMTIVNDNSGVINKLETSLTDDARIVIYDCHMFIVQAMVEEILTFIFQITHSKVDNSGYFTWLFWAGPWTNSS
jgi:hypothetical protein